MSQQSKRLEVAIANTNDPEKRIELISKLAIHLARVGNTEIASEKLRKLREAGGSWASGRSHLWLMLAEAITLWFQDLSDKAIDRVYRVQLLSGAMNFVEVHALSSAWRAHMHFETSQFDSMMIALRDVKNVMQPQNHAADARFSIVICSALAYCNEFNAAHSWFLRARQSALADGDLVSVEALQYNRAALSVTALRVAFFSDVEMAVRIEDIRFEVETSRNFQSLTQFSALMNHFHLIDARLCILEKRYAAAIPLYELSRLTGPFASLSSTCWLIDLEISYCVFMMGGDAASSGFMKPPPFDIMGQLDPDDQIAACGMLMAMSSAGVGYGDSLALKAMRTELVAANALQQARLLQELSEFNPQKCDP